MEGNRMVPNRRGENPPASAERWIVQPASGRQAQRTGTAARARARRELLARAASVDPEPKARRSTRKAGTNPRAKRTNPRAQATNPTAGLDSDIARVARMKRQALARYYVREGERWCLHCDDTGWIQAADSPHVEPCADHRQMTTVDADMILRPDDD